MSKFKVGDRVVANENVRFARSYIGEQGTVTRVLGGDMGEGHLLSVDFDNGYQATTWSDFKFDLVSADNLDITQAFLAWWFAVPRRIVWSFDSVDINATVTLPMSEWYEVMCALWAIDFGVGGGGAIGTAFENLEKQLRRHGHEASSTFSCDNGGRRYRVRNAYRFTHDE